MYGRKSKYVRRYARKGRKSVAGLAKGKTTSVQALAKAVRGLQRKARSQHQYLNYVQSASQTNIVADVTTFNLCDYSNYAPVFGTDADDDNNYKIIHQSTMMDMYLSLENLVNDEENTITFSIYLVSLKDQIGSAFTASSGNLVLTAGQHYHFQNGLVMLNKKALTIHKAKRVTLTNHNTALGQPSAQTQYGTDCRWQWKFAPRNVIQNPVGDWKALRSAMDPSKQYYLLAFSDNSTADLESPCLTYNFVHTMKTIV